MKRFSGLLIIIMFVFAGFVNAAEITLRWDKNTESDLAGYKLYYKADSPGSPYDGTGSDQGPSPVDIPLNSLSDPDNPEFTITGLDNDNIYFLVLTAYDDEDPFNESGYSNEVQTFYISSPENGFVVSDANYTSFSVSGRGAAGATVDVYSDAIFVGAGTVESDCSWSVNVDFTHVNKGSIDLSAEIGNIVSNLSLIHI